MVVQCVYGENSINQVQDVLIPSLKTATLSKVQLYTMNYDPLCPLRLDSFEDQITVTDVENPFASLSGFAQNHNYLFKQSRPENYFICINPDVIATPGSLDKLVETKRQQHRRVGIVESRQWPFDHPKEYDSEKKVTPWASGACCLIDSEFYSEVGGMAEEYGMYCEDVDLSWRAWLSGYQVLFEHDSVVIHFTDGPFRKAGEITSEVIFSLSNFIALSFKFFGPDEETKAIKMITDTVDSTLAKVVIDRYLSQVKPLITPLDSEMHPQIKITGLNQYHELRAR
jgi:hypothetical protein